jgi:hypothetical protein
MGEVGSPTKILQPFELGLVSIFMLWPWCTAVGRHHDRGWFYMKEKKKNALSLGITTDKSRSVNSISSKSYKALG